MDVYDSHNNIFLRKAKNLVPRKITYGSFMAFGLVEKNTVKNNDYYCFISNCSVIGIERAVQDDVISKLSLTDYFNISNRLLDLKLKLNLRKIIYDSNRNK
jgi:hypothetical protein